MKRSPLRRVSAKRAKQNKEYSKLRKEYLEAHPICEIWLAENQTKLLHTEDAEGLLGEAPRSTEIHHRKGRFGSRLNDTQFWMATCENCHRLIHANPKWAHEKGYLLPR